VTHFGLDEVGAIGAGPMTAWAWQVVRSYVPNSRHSLLKWMAARSWSCY